MHLILIDGAIAKQGDSFSFHPAHLNPSDALLAAPALPAFPPSMAVTVLREAIRARVLRLFKRRGLLYSDVIDNLKAWGHGGGFSVHADVCVPAYDKAGRERLFKVLCQTHFRQ